MKKENRIFCKKCNITEKQFSGKEKISGNLYLGWLTSVPEGFNPTVGENLYLGGLTSVPKGFNPTVGWSLYLDGLTSVPEGFNPTVGGGLFLGRGLFLSRLAANKTDITQSEIEKRLTWKDGKFRVFDGIFCEVISEHSRVFKVKVKGKIKYVVFDGENCAHGSSIKDARESLIYKISNRDTSAYNEYTLETVVDWAEAVKMYRTITGACSEGARMFANGLEKIPVSLTIDELIKLTDEQYGNEKLKEFFTR